MTLLLKRLRAVLRYDPEPGHLTWLKKTNKRIVFGAIAGTVNKVSGYRYISVDGKRFKAHRLIWFYMTGKWPKADVDHRNNFRDDNRWKNLREGSRSFNLENQRRAHKNSKVGLLGVRKNANSFHARIQVRGKAIHLGAYRTPEAAHAAYVAAKRRLHKGNTL